MTPEGHPTRRHFLAEGLVTAMGGRIWVDSVEGRGAIFAFELPAATREISVEGR